MPGVDSDVNLVSDVRPVDEPSLVWQQLSEKVDAFIAAWAGESDPPVLAGFVPSDPPGLRHMVLVELVKVDLEHRWQGRRAPKLLEDYLAEFPELCDGANVPGDLIYEEYHIRKQLGDGVTPDDYCKRFPAQAAELRRLLGLESVNATTSLVTVEKPLQPKVGSRLDDFDLLSQLGKGAFATVYLARQISMQRLVALKVSSDRGSEPQTMAQLDHAHIVRVFDQRHMPDSKLRLLYMQYIPGGTLQGVVERIARTPMALRTGKTLLEAVDDCLLNSGNTPPTGSTVRRKLEHATWPEAVCWLGARLASALAYAHERGVLHRDVKPANVLVCGDGSPKLADFNISFSSKLDGATPAAYFGGSLAYMSPEQLEACDPAHERQPEELDGRSDVYSLGVMLWELLTGRRPFDDAAPGSAWSRTLAHMVKTREAGVNPEMRALVPSNCPSGMLQTLLKCLAANRDERFQTAAEGARQLDLCLQPRAQRLMDQPVISWMQLARRYPVATVLIGGILPNAVMSALNITYNWLDIMRHLSHDDQEVFWNILQSVNGVAYTVGVSWVVWHVWPVFKAVLRLVAGKPVEPAGLMQLRSRSLQIGDYVARVSAIEWTISGIVFPALIQARASASALSTEDYVHFIGSQALCGLIAATLTFFFVTALSVRLCYPLLARPGTTEPDETAALSALAQRVWIYFGVAVSVPILTVMLLVVLDTSKVEVVALLGFGLGGFALAFWLALGIRNDLTALASVINPAGHSLSASTENDSFWTGSHG